MINLASKFHVHNLSLKQWSPQLSGSACDYFSLSKQMSHCVVIFFSYGVGYGGQDMNFKVIFFVIIVKEAFYGA